MKAKILSITAILLIVAGGFSACNEPEDVLTGNFYVIMWAQEKLDECGFVLSVLHPSMTGWNIVYAKNLPKEFQVNLLPVTVTYQVLCRGNQTLKNGKIVRTDCVFPIIHIINIRKR